MTGCDSVQRRPRAASSGKAAGSYQHLGWGWPLFLEAGQVVLAIPFKARMPISFCRAFWSTCGPKLAWE